MANINVQQLKPLPDALFRVTIVGKETTTHQVSLSQDDYEKLTNDKIAPEELIKKSFEFLLVREPNTSILAKFDLRKISHYFPEYEEKIKSSSHDN